MQLDIDEVHSVEDYNDFLEVTPCPSTPKLAAKQEPTSGTTEDSENVLTQLDQCENCGRRFFPGKLEFHLKMCTKEKPMMIRSPVKSEKGNIVQQACLAGSQFHSITPKPGHKNSTPKVWTCPECKLRVPISIAQFHKDHCTGTSQPVFHSAQTTPRGSNSNHKSILPRIINRHQPVKIREELSCFSRAAAIQQVQCVFCGRKFQKNAALRHVPVCEKITDRRDMKVKHKMSTAQNRRPAKQVAECTGCRKALLSDHKFCGFCGARRVDSFPISSTELL